jgi:hypothetical protein
MLRPKIVAAPLQFWFLDVQIYEKISESLSAWISLRVFHVKNDPDKI